MNLFLNMNHRSNFAILCNLVLPLLNGMYGSMKLILYCFQPNTHERISQNDSLVFNDYQILVNQHFFTRDVLPHLRGEMIKVFMPFVSADLQSS